MRWMICNSCRVGPALRPEKCPNELSVGSVLRQVLRVAKGFLRLVGLAGFFVRESEALPGVGELRVELDGLLERGDGVVGLTTVHGLATAGVCFSGRGDGV